MADIEKTACRYAWTYPIIDLGRKELRNCCRTPFNSITDKDLEFGIDVFKNLEAIKKLKRDLLQGIQSEKCRTCWTSENYGIKSPRTGFDDFAKFIKAVKWHNMSEDEIKHVLKNLTPAQVEELVELEHPDHVEISLSTTCDLKCVYCSHVFSTQWATEKLKYKEITIEQLPSNDNPHYEEIWWDWFDKVAHKTVHKITFVGGEPLINEKFYHYVDKLIQYYEGSERRLHIFVATNLNTPKKFFDRFLDSIRKILNSKNVSIGIGLSFESTGNKNDFIRTNANWETFSNNVSNLLNFIKEHNPNIDKTRKYHRANIVIMPSFNTLSISDMPQFINYLVNLRKVYDRPIRISTTHVTYPMRFSPFILTKDFCKYIDESIEILKSNEFYNELPQSEPGNWIALVDYLESIKESIMNNTIGIGTKIARVEFAEDIKKLCERRKLNFESTFPEMVEFFKICAQ